MAHDAGWILRLKVLWSRRRLDRALAAGQSPGDRPELALRADQLTAARNRRGLAAVIGNLLDAADEPPGPLEYQTPARALNRPAIARAAGELIVLAARLAGERPITPLAAARVQLLLSDESSPLYGTGAPDAVEAAIDAVRGALDTSRGLDRHEVKGYDRFR